jgi:hypothetical protein
MTVIPAKAGIQPEARKPCIPAVAEVTSPWR